MVYAVVGYAAITHTLTDARHRSAAVVLDGAVVDKAAQVALGIVVIRTYMHLVAALPQAFYLCQHLLADAAARVKTMICKK